MPKGIPNPADMYGISARPWGFEVSLVRNGVRYTRLFGHASYGGPQQALRRAQAWRDTIVKEHPPIARRERAQTLRSNNKTGAPGVSPRLSAQGKPVAWLAKTYLGHEEVLRTEFELTDWGHAARAQAIGERQRQLARMVGLARLHPAEEAIRKRAPVDEAALPRKRSKSEIVRRNNTSGVSGVQFKTPRAGHPGYWVAITYTAGKGSVSKSFSVRTLGYDTARDMAIAEREKQLRAKSA
ncbi:AP2 domain-containing protein [Variovorax sp. Root473]|uniref:AP2 domain-containing protein n=1 Tax=Variovorax sp. Root473 TaxID=1736541 RepID=UPI000AB10DD5|nr:AP2 domain-containing protein [Variovorax sp. Root473]